MWKKWNISGKVLSSLFAQLVETKSTFSMGPQYNLSGFLQQIFTGSAPYLLPNKHSDRAEGEKPKRK